MRRETCVCGAEVAEEEGARHPYVPAVAGCWRVFGEVQAEELGRYGYPEVHSLVVDAYMASHPGDGRDRRERQSVAVHLVGLCLWEQGVRASVRRRVLSRAVGEVGELPRAPVEFGGMSVLDMRGARSLPEYTARAEEWGRRVWGSWEEAHPVVEEWVRRAWE